ncbi:MAG: hypothetical protein BRD30_05200, partial [Bacteroidetes bacterium QH_2_63_10]
MAASISIFGAGSWGTALAIHLAKKGRDIALWARRDEAVEQMRRTRRNPTYLSDVDIPSSVDITSDVETAAAATSLWAMVVPSQNLRSVAARLSPYTRAGVTVVSLAKGIENETLLTMSQVLADELSGLSKRQIGVLYGPSHAEEVAEGRPTTVPGTGPKTLRGADRGAHSLPCPFGPGAARAGRGLSGPGSDTGRPGPGSEPALHSHASAGAAAPPDGRRATWGQLYVRGRGDARGERN